jgi:phosphate-selective porin OprO/OprP
MWRITLLVVLVATTISPQAHAQSARSTDAEITGLKKQMLEEKLDKIQKRTDARIAAIATAPAKPSAPNNSAALPVKGAAGLPEAVAVVLMPNNGPTICTAEQQNCVAITSRLHFDVGGYDYHPNTAASVPQRLDDGFNARRARIGVLGKFWGDWNYALIYDFAGTSDGLASSASVNSASVGFLPGGALSGIENAYLSYTGIKAFGRTLAIEGGYMDIPYTIDEATSSNDIVFMERASSQVIATNIAANDFRSTFGARWYNNVFWAAGCVTGPTAGAIHSAWSVNPPGTTEQYGAVARVAGQIVSGNDYSLHLGADAEFLINPPHNLVANTQTLTLSDRPELRIDPTAIVSTGALANVSGAEVYSAEAAATYGPLFFQGEYFWYNVDRNFRLGLTDVKFEGG